MEEGDSEGLMPKRKVGDPSVLFGEWRFSSVYGEAKKKFFEGKKLASDVTEKEKASVFEDGMGAKSSLLSFVRDGDFEFVYDPKMYSKEVHEDMANYVEIVKYIHEESKRGSVDRDKIENFDIQRSMMHVKVSKTLVDDGVTPNMKMARTFARIILISKGLDTYESAGKRDVDRVMAMG